LGGRLYRTGDLARYLADGVVEFLGRSDDQVKIRGYRVELEEIEAILGQHPAILNAAVKVRDDVRGDKALVAYAVVEGDAVVDVAELRGFLQEKLPEHMVPSAFVMLDALPQTPHGKVDRRALPAPDWSRRELEDVYVAPRTPVEEVLSGIWEQVIGVDQVGVTDSFFELGGHSLLAVQVISRVRNAFGVVLPLQNLFEAPTVAGQAKSIEIARWLTQSSTGQTDDAEEGYEEGKL
jgi:acyl carrier protein